MFALVLVDLQNDFMPGGALAVPGGDEVVPVANALAERIPLVVATQDWHPLDHVSFAANHPGQVVGDLVMAGDIPQILWPVHCVQGTAGAELHPGLDQGPIAAVFHKGTDPTIDSYSTFFDNGHRKSTGLAEVLHRHGVKEVVLCGLATDYCVRFSALDALAEGFAVTVVADGCRAVDLVAGDGDRALAEIVARGGRVVTSAQWLEQLATAPTSQLPALAGVGSSP